MVKGTYHYRVLLVCQIIERISRLGPCGAFSSLLAEPCCAKIPTPPFLSLTLVEKECRRILLWLSGQGGHLNISITISTFTALFVGRWNVEKCCPTALKRT